MPTVCRIALQMQCQPHRNTKPSSSSIHLCRRSNLPASSSNSSRGSRCCRMVALVGTLTVSSNPSLVLAMAAAAAASYISSSSRSRSRMPWSAEAAVMLRITSSSIGRWLPLDVVSTRLHQMQWAQVFVLSHYTCSFLRVTATLLHYVLAC